MKENEQKSSDIQLQYDRLSHPHCGTSKCCGKCSTASYTTEAFTIKVNNIDLEKQLEDEFESHCKAFFKGE